MPIVIKHISNEAITYIIPLLGGCGIPAPMSVPIALIEQDQKRFIKILKAELEIFEPLAVITWGQVATTTVNSIGLSGNHFEFPHPSPANHKTWSNLMGKPATRANRVNFWQEKVLAFLNKL